MRIKAAKQSDSYGKSILFIGVLLAIALLCLSLLNSNSFLIVLFSAYFYLLFGSALFGLLIGAVNGMASGQWQQFRRALKIFLGNFYIPQNQSTFIGLTLGLIRHSWEFPQIALGQLWAQVLNSIGLIHHVEYFAGATFSITSKAHKASGMSLGSFIHIAIDDSLKSSFRERLLSDPLFMHEFGHSLDSRLFGIFYLPFIGLPSLISAARTKKIMSSKEPNTSHKFQPYERRANRRAAIFFSDYGIDWKDFEFNYPRK